MHFNYCQDLSPLVKYIFINLCGAQIIYLIEQDCSEVTILIYQVNIHL